MTYVCQTKEGETPCGGNATKYFFVAPNLPVMVCPNCLPAEVIAYEIPGAS